MFFFKTSKTLYVKMQNNTKNFEKITEINNETVKKKQQLSYTKDRVKKADICSIMARLCSLGFFRFVTRTHVESPRRKNLRFFGRKPVWSEQNRLITDNRSISLRPLL